MSATLKERTDYLATCLAEGERTGSPRTYTVFFHGENRHLPVINVQTSMLLYRLANHRTSTSQLRYLETNAGSVPDDLFADEESELAQRAQETILLDFVDKNGLREDLLKRKQAEPLILTSKGVVVNGNRRLAVFRTNGVSYADCIVLPEPALPDEIYKLEMELQVRQDFKAGYDWVNELLAIRDGMEKYHLERRTDFAELMNLQSPQEVTLRLNMLAMVDAYLARNGLSGKYHRVGPPEQLEEAFRTIAKRHAKLRENLREPFRIRSFALIDDPPSEGRIYDHLNSLASELPRIMEREKRTYNVAEPHEARPAARDDPIGLIPVEVEPDERIEDIYRTPERAASHAPDFTDILLGVEESERDRKRGTQALKSAAAALSKLESMVIDDTTQDLFAVAAQLDAIAARLKGLQADLARRMAG